MIRTSWRGEIWVSRWSNSSLGCAPPKSRLWRAARVMRTWSSDGVRSGRSRASFNTQPSAVFGPLMPLDRPVFQMSCRRSNRRRDAELARLIELLRWQLSSCSECLSFLELHLQVGDVLGREVGGPAGGVVKRTHGGARRASRSQVEQSVIGISATPPVRSLSRELQPQNPPSASPATAPHKAGSFGGIVGDVLSHARCQVSDSASEPGPKPPALRT